MPINKPCCRLKSRASLSIGRSRARVYREVDLETAAADGGGRWGGGGQD